MVFGFAISWLFAGNPASPQSVPSSVLLNFFMSAPMVESVFLVRRSRRYPKPAVGAPGRGLPLQRNIITDLARGRSPRGHQEQCRSSQGSGFLCTQMDRMMRSWRNQRLLKIRRAAGVATPSRSLAFPPPHACSSPRQFRNYFFVPSGPNCLR